MFVLWVVLDIAVIISNAVVVVLLGISIARDIKNRKGGKK